MSMKGTVIVVGASGMGTSHLIEQILRSVAMTMDDLIIVDGLEEVTGRQLQEMMLERPEPKVMKLERLHIPDMMPEYVYTKEDLANAHPFSKFMKKGFKRR